MLEPSPMKLSSPLLRGPLFGALASLPATLVILTLDMMLGFDRAPLTAGSQLALGLALALPLVWTVALVAGLAGGLLQGSVALLGQPRRRGRLLLDALRDDPEIDRTVAATLLTLPLAGGVQLAGNALTQATWTSAMANPLLAALATGLLAVLWLLPSLAVAAPLFLGWRLVLGLVPARLGGRHGLRTLLAGVALLLLLGVGLLLLLRRVDLAALPLLRLALLGLLLLLLTVAIGGGLARLTRLPRGTLPAALGSVLLPLLLLPLPLWQLGDQPAVAKSLLTPHSLTGLLIQTGRTMLDRDEDGYASLLGGGDCNDRDPEVNPAAAEIPGDGIDNNCLDGDAPPRVPSPEEAARPTAAPAPPASTVPAALPASTVPAPTAPDAGEHAGTALPAPPAPPAETPPPATADPARPPTGAPLATNLLVILVDTVRADHVGAYGYARPTTPRIDALAAEGILFERCYAQSPHTPRSIPSIFTSRLPSQIRWHKPRISYPLLVPENLTFAEALAAQGMATGLAASHFFFEPKYGATQGFTEIDNTGATSLPDSNKDIASPRIVKRLHGRLAQLQERTHRGERFLLFVHLFEPHSTYMRHPAPDDFGRGWMDLYDGEIHFVDRHVGMILDRLAEVGLADSTAVVLLSDHGEGNGEHGFKWHGQHIYNEGMHVPLILRVPGAAPRRIATPVALLDVGPTLLDLAGFPIPESFQGRSLVPAVRGEQLPEIPVFGQLLPYPYCKEEVHSLILGPHKVLFHRTNNTWALYDLLADPQEQQDIFAKEPARARELQQLLLGALEGR
ncbi:MAG: sulfatase-like hydrolase/transferase [Myxococcota bacterium]|nr:sulfatase-like hydrolase/transferase [Myxococcota bacterium]